MNTSVLWLVLADQLNPAHSWFAEVRPDYCKGCHYDKKARLGEKACPFNALYWDFFARHRQRLSGKQRLGSITFDLLTLPTT